MAQQPTTTMAVLSADLSHETLSLVVFWGKMNGGRGLAESAPLNPKDPKKLLARLVAAATRALLGSQQRAVMQTFLPTNDSIFEFPSVFYLRIPALQPPLILQSTPADLSPHERPHFRIFFSLLLSNSRTSASISTPIHASILIESQPLDQVRFLVQVVARLSPSPGNSTVLPTRPRRMIGYLCPDTASLSSVFISYQIVEPTRSSA